LQVATKSTRPRCLQQIHVRREFENEIVQIPIVQRYEVGQNTKFVEHKSRVIFYLMTNVKSDYVEYSTENNDDNSVDAEYLKKYIRTFKHYFFPFLLAVQKFSIYIFNCFILLEITIFIVQKKF
jgi:hypothetical protein